MNSANPEPTDHGSPVLHDIDSSMPLSKDDIQVFSLHDTQIPLRNVPVHADQFAESPHESELGIEWSLRSMLMARPCSMTKKF